MMEFGLIAALLSGAIGMTPPTPLTPVAHAMMNTGTVLSGILMMGGAASAPPPLPVPPPVPVAPPAPPPQP